MKKTRKSHKNSVFGKLQKFALKSDERRKVKGGNDGSQNETTNVVTEDLADI